MRVIILVLALFASVSLIAQKDSLPKNSFKISVGLNQVKEKNLHSKVHNGAFYGLDYSRERFKKNISNFNFSLQFSKIKTSFEKSSVSMNIKLNFDYAYLFKLLKKSKVSFYLGPYLSLQYRLCYFPNWDDSHLYWSDDFSLGIEKRLIYQINKKTGLLFKLNMSFFSVFSRPDLNREYKIDDVSFVGVLKNMHSNIEAGTINKSFNINFGTEYQIKVSKKVTQAISYSFHYSRFKAQLGKPFINLQHSLGLKLYF